MDRKKICIGALLGLALVGLVWQLKPSPKQEQVEAKADMTAPQGDKLKPLQNEIAKLSDEEIRLESATLEAQVRKDNLIARLNSNQVSDDERKTANETLLRLALLGVERKKRDKAKAESQAQALNQQEQ